MHEAIPTELLRRLLDATPQQRAAIELILGIEGGCGIKNEKCKLSDGRNEKFKMRGGRATGKQPAGTERIRIGRFSYLPGFNQVWLGEEVFDLSKRTKARLCIEYLVVNKAFDAASARHLETEIDPFVRQQGGFPPAAEIRIYDYFGDRNGPLTKLRQGLIRTTSRQGRFFLNTQ